MYTMSEMVKQGGSSVYKTEPVYRKKRLKKWAAEHVYYLTDGKTERQNLCIEKKIEKRGGGTCILFKRW